MIEAILRRISIGFVITTMLSELLEERTRVFDRFDSCGPTRGSEEGGMIDQWGEGPSVDFLYAALWRRRDLFPARRVLR
jgi:hypothetical protein